jgi:cupin fold WbuC family metalloprotein
MSDPRLKCIDPSTLRELGAKAAASPRRRMNLNLHERLDDPAQRLLNAFEPGTYVRPHRHADKWELFVWLQGAAAVLIFDDRATLLERADLAADGVRVVEIPPNTWHTLVALVPDTILFETKRGPFDPGVRAEFAAWSPAEGDPAAAGLERRLRTARCGEVLV